VEGESPVGSRIIQQAVPDHGKGSSGGLFGGLENEKDLSGKSAPLLRKPPGSPQETGGMDIMAAGVHSSRVPGPPGKIPLFLYRQSVHVRPEQNSTPGFPSVEKGGNAASGHEAPWNAQGIKPGAHDPGGLLQVGIKLRAGMKPAAHANEILKKILFIKIVLFSHFPFTPLPLRNSTENVPERENPFILS
jgi:hypothetical protein